MRIKYNLQPYLEFPLASKRKVVQEYLQKYDTISQLLDANPTILDLAHEDFKKLSEENNNTSQKRDRPSTYTSDSLLRALIVQCVEQVSYRDVVIQIDRNDCLKQFCRLGPCDVMDYTFLCKAFRVLSPKTLKKINTVLSSYAIENEHMDPTIVRTDTTVVETNIHYPTDSSLLWDCARVLIRLLRNGRTYAPDLLNNRFHDKKLKRLFVAITRGCRSKAKGRKAKIAKRKVKKYFRKFISGVQRLVDVAEPFVVRAVSATNIELKTIGTTLESLLPDVKKVVKQSIRAQLNGETVPASERIFSIFEPHTELIVRGKARKAVEFGHKILLTEAEGTFITDYNVLLATPNDRNLAEEVVKRHKKLYGEAPEVLAGDAGFHPREEKRKELEEQVDVLAIPSKVSDRIKEELVPWHRFRAGVEGTISVLKRAFRLFRCVYRGFNNFAANVGMGVFCHNLVLLSRLQI
jgi:IS5 family transposase